jgi:hypothetical protein
MVLSAKYASEKTTLFGCGLLRSRAGAALIFGHAAQNFVLVLATASPGCFVAGFTGHLTAHG